MRAINKLLLETRISLNEKSDYQSRKKDNFSCEIISKKNKVFVCSQIFATQLGNKNVYFFKKNFSTLFFLSTS